MNLEKIYTVITQSALVFSILLISSELSAQVQIPTNQDCLGAIPVCTDVYYQALSFQGDGNYNDEIGASEPGCPNNCLDHEKNSVWYVISVQQSGLLKFTITPVSSADDYDWAVYNLNDHECSEIRNGALLMMSSCNAAGYLGTTGICSSCGGDSDCEDGGNTNKWNADLPVETGDTYVVCVSNWTETQSGYTLDFGASTAVIFDTIAPFITVIDTVKGCSGSATVNFDFNENILCESVEASDFTIIGPDGLHYVGNVTGAGCAAGGTQEKFFTLSNFSPTITESGVYTIAMTDSITDLCINTGIAPPAQFYAEMDPLPEVTDQPDDAQVPIGGTATFHIETIGANAFAWQERSEGGFWSYLSETPPYSGTTTNTLSINPTTIDLGGKEFRCKVSGVCSPASQSLSATLFVGDQLAASASANPDVICVGNSSQLDVSAMGGNVLEPYTYLWEGPGGWTSTLEKPVVSPTSTSTYNVTVYDGYNPVTVPVLVIVNPLPIADAGDDQEIYNGTVTTLYGNSSGSSPVTSWNWKPSDSLWDNAEQNPVTRQLRGSTQFSLIVTDQNGCVSLPDYTSVQILGGPLTASPQAQPAIICNGETSQLYAGVGGGNPLSYSYKWKANGVEFSTSPDPIVSPSQSTNYTLVIFDGFYEITKQVNLTVNPLPDIHLIKPQYFVEDGVVQICFLDSITIDPGYLNATYLWSNGSTDYNNTISTSGLTFDYQEHYITITDNSTGCINTDTIAIAFTFTACSYGLNELSFSDLIKVYPNPANTNVNVLIDGEPDIFIIELTDILGRLIYSEKINKSFAGVLNHSIDLTKFSNATCLLRISSEKGSVVKKVLINH